MAVIALTQILPRRLRSTKDHSDHSSRDPCQAIPYTQPRVLCEHRDTRAVIQEELADLMRFFSRLCFFNLSLSLSFLLSLSRSRPSCAKSSTRSG